MREFELMLRIKSACADLKSIASDKKSRKQIEKQARREHVIVCDDR